MHIIAPLALESRSIKIASTLYGNFTRFCQFRICIRHTLTLSHSHSLSPRGYYAGDEPILEPHRVD